MNLNFVRKLDTPLEKLVGEFEAGWNAGTGNYSQKLVEFCSERALISDMGNVIQEKINDGSFSRFTFDLMLAWERPSYYDEDQQTVRTTKLFLSLSEQEELIFSRVYGRQRVYLFTFLRFAGACCKGERRQEDTSECYQ